MSDADIAKRNLLLLFRNQQQQLLDLTAISPVVYHSVMTNLGFGPTTLAKADKDNNVAAEFVRKSAEHQRHDGMRRKSGLANALLPSPLPDGLAGSTSRLTASHRTVSPACAPTPKPAEPPPPPPFEDDAPKSINELLMGRPMLSTTTQSPSCYESLSEESDTEKGGEETTMAATKKNSAGLCSTSAAVAAPLNFFSLLDLMDETDNEQQQQQQQQQRRTTTVAEPSAPTGDDASPASAFAAVAALRNQHQQQQQLSILTTAAAQWADVGLRKTDKLGAERGEEECVYEPLSEDET
uniref:Uncharacterized protein n=1 Tax=Globodera pallida TaxID=36090 RepID=A0A183C5E5_GLOPA